MPYLTQGDHFESSEAKRGARSAPILSKATLYRLAILWDIVKNGLNPTNSDWLGVTPLHRAAADGYIDMAAVYLEAGADINAMDTDSSSTPLGWAARHGKTEMVKWFLQKGVDPQLPQDESWATPFTWAGRRGHDEIKTILVNRNDNC